MGELDPWQMPQKNAVRVEGALGRPCGPRCIDDQGGIIGSGFYGLECTGCLSYGLPETDCPLTSTCSRHKNRFEMGEPVPYPQDLVQIRAVRHDRFGLAVAQVILKGVGAEEDEEGRSAIAPILYAAM